jgi:hypothetical protein
MKPFSLKTIQDIPTVAFPGCASELLLECRQIQQRKRHFIDLLLIDLHPASGTELR